MRQRWFAWFMARASARHEELVADRKRRLFAGVGGAAGETVVEIGPGTGPNLAYLPRGVRYIAVEPNAHMHPYLVAAAREKGLPVELVAPVDGRLPFQDGTIDAVVCTLVLCSVRDPARLVAEARRILKAGGRFIVLEHVAAPRGTWMRRVQAAATPLTRLLADGCRQDRETWRVLEDAGFTRLEVERFDVAVPWRSPHLAAVAIR